LDQICLNLQKLLPCLAILTSTIFRADLINLPYQSTAFFLLAVCRIRISRKISYIKPYRFCYSSFWNLQSSDQPTFKTACDR